MIEINAIRLTGGENHEHIAFLQWRNTQTESTGQSTRQAIVEWLEESKANQAVVAHQGKWVYVGVVSPQSDLKYLRTYADGTWTDNLLSLPRF